MPHTKKIKCDKCHGEGRISVIEQVNCTFCYGTGRENGCFIDTDFSLCTHCNASGKMWRNLRKCAECSGKGYVVVIHASL